jgi:hypothetical protein
MGTIKEGRKVLHQPSTLEIFYCLSGMPIYSKILAEQSTDKPYSGLLQWLIERDFYNDQTDKIAIKKIASDYKSDSTKVTKWIKMIYEDIFELNDNKPELFQADGIKLSMYIKHYDNSCMFYTALPVLPREFETVKFPFLKSKVGIEDFWVKKVEHEIIENTSNVTIWLKGGTVNKYREYAVDKALFQGWIHFMDVYQKHDFELDEKLKRLYRT